MPKVRDKPKGVVHGVGEGPFVDADHIEPVTSAHIPPEPPQPPASAPRLVPLTIWLRPWVYDCMSWEANQIGTPLEVFVALHLERCCK
jgi:hypothetical protein